eukprot:8412652-Pyramimonas_sp.AAC.1
MMRMTVFTGYQPEHVVLPPQVHILPGMSLSAPPSGMARPVLAAAGGFGWRRAWAQESPDQLPRPPETRKYRVP